MDRGSIVSLNDRRVIFACVLLLIAAGVARAQSVAITHVEVIDTTGGPTRHDMNVVIRDGHIASVGGAVPDSVQVVDGRGKFLIPAAHSLSSSSPPEAPASARRS